MTRVEVLKAFFRAIIAKIPSALCREFLLFCMKQLWSGLFGVALLLGIILTHYWYPLEGVERYDFLFLYALSIQVLLIIFRLESFRECGVIILFHLLAIGMELFKTHDMIGSWSYPEPAFFKIGNVPLFAGFMYSAVGSFMARTWKIMDLEFRCFPPLAIALGLALLSYLNFFTHHFVFDMRWVLICFIAFFYRKSIVMFRPDKKIRKMPVLLSYLMIAFFIWVAENIATFARAWIYPGQENEWSMISLQKWTAWFLLMQLSFVFIYSLRHLEQKYFGGSSYSKTN